MSATMITDPIHSFISQSPSVARDMRRRDRRAQKRSYRGKLGKSRIHEEDRTVRARYNARMLREHATRNGLAADARRVEDILDSDLPSGPAKAVPQQSFALMDEEFFLFINTIPVDALIN